MAVPYGQSRVARRAEGAPEAAVGAVGDDGELGADLDGRRRLPPVDAVGGAAHEAAVDHRVHRFVALQQARTGGRGVVGDHRVEVATANDVAVVGVDRVARPLQLELAAGPGGAQPVVAVEALEPGRRGPCRRAGAPPAG